MARHSLLCSYTWQPREVSRLPCSIHGFQDSLASTCLLDRRLTTTRLGFTCNARLERFRRDKGHVVCSHHRLLDKEEKGLAMRSILPRDTSTGGRCAQARHTLSHGSRQGLTPSQKVASTSLAKSWHPHHCRPLQSSRLSASSQWPALIGVLQAV